MATYEQELTRVTWRVDFEGNLGTGAGWLLHVEHRRTTSYTVAGSSVTFLSSISAIQNPAFSPSQTAEANDWAKLVEEVEGRLNALLGVGGYAYKLTLVESTTPGTVNTVF